MMTSKCYRGQHIQMSHVTLKYPGGILNMARIKKFKMLSGRMHLLSNAEPACVSPLRV